jgi:predicted TIM-barrel fold metal-dependent hydrolase
MIASGVFDRHPKLQALIAHMGGGLAAILGHLEFNWRLKQNGIQSARRHALHEQEVAIRLLQDRHFGRQHGVQRYRNASCG